MLIDRLTVYDSKRDAGIEVTCKLSSFVFFFFQLHFDGCLPVNLEKKWDWSNLVKSGDTNIAFPKPVGLLLPLIFLFVLFLRYA